MSGKPTIAGQIVIDSLDRMAAQHFCGAVLISRRPSTPSFWFFGLAIDAGAMAHPVLHDNLGDASKWLIELGEIGGRDAVEIGERDHWCSCDDAEFHSRSYRGPRPDICWPCLFGCHERCSFGCSWEGEIHFPERIYLRSTEALDRADSANDQEASCPAVASDARS